jgi:hypothetical protein
MHCVLPFDGTFRMASPKNASVHDLHCIAESGRSVSGYTLQGQLPKLPRTVVERDVL